MSETSTTQRRVPWWRSQDARVIAALWAGFTILGVIFGHVSLSQIKKDGGNGRGMAIAGLVIGYIFIALFAIFWISVIANSSTNSDY